MFMAATLCDGLRDEFLRHPSKEARKTAHALPGSAETAGEVLRCHARRDVVARSRASSEQAWRL